MSTDAAPDPEERARISRALVELCFERGYRRLDLPTLLERVALQPSSFKRHFADLEDCFCQTYQDLSNEYLFRVGAAYAAQQGWRNQLRASIYEGLRILREDLPRARFLYIEVLSAGSRAQLVRDRNMEAMFDLVDLGRKELVDPHSVPTSTAVSIAGGIYERVHEAIEHDDPSTWVAKVPEFMYVLVLPYLGPEAALEELQIPAPRDLPPPAPSETPPGALQGR